MLTPVIQDSVWIMEPPIPVSVQMAPQVPAVMVNMMSAQGIHILYLLV